jgi:hypothetical protein
VPRRNFTKSLFYYVNVVNNAVTSYRCTWKRSEVINKGWRIWVHGASWSNDVTPSLDRNNVCCYLRAIFMIGGTRLKGYNSPRTNVNVCLQRQLRQCKIKETSSLYYVYYLQIKHYTFSAVWCMCTGAMTTHTAKAQYNVM